MMHFGSGLVSAKPTTTGLSQQDKNHLEVCYSPRLGSQYQSVFCIQPIMHESEAYILLLGVHNSSDELQPDVATERRLNLALRSGGYALWDHDFETGETYNSPEMVQIFGRQIGDQPLNYQSFETLGHPDDKEKSINAKILEAPFETEVFQTRSRIKTGTGKYAWIETVASLVRDQATGKPKKCVGLCRNIDHEMLTMERLKNSELMLKRTQAVSHIGSFKLRIESGVSRLTAELAAMIGLADAMVHPNLDTFIKMVEPTDREKLLEGIELAKMGKPIRNLEIAVKSQKGNLEWFAVTLEPERLPNGTIDSIFGACQLITERKSLEDRFQQAQKMEAVGQLTGGIAHDFNNLLMVVMGNLQLVEKLVASDEKATKRIRAAMEAAEKGSDLTRRMLAFSRQQTLQNRDLQLNDMINAMQDMLRQAITAAVELHVIPNAEVWPVKADKTMLETAILNLAINARDAMAKNNGGKLIIETANRTLDAGYSDNNEEIKPGDYVEIAVTDTGSGIAPENLSKVFQPFFTTKGPEAGSGLGLSMIYGFVKQSGGHVKIYSEVGIGTSVKLYLPRNKSISVSAPTEIQTTE
ncbi:MAG: ATP-binding protein, partial [Aestuariivirga sp.]